MGFEKREKMVRKSTFLEARASAGRTGKAAYNIMDIMEERESQLRQSRLTVSKKPRLSMAGEGTAEEEEDTGPDLSTIELDLENLALEFPDECLIYMSNKMEIGLDDEKREKEYECFRQCCMILNKMKNHRQTIRNKQTQRDAELLLAMYKIYPENCATPFWVKTAITRVTDDTTFSTAAEEFFESNDDIDPIDFAEFMYFPKLNAAERKKSMHLAAIIAANDSKKETSLDTNVNTRMERRDSLTKEEKAKNASRRQSMLAVTDIAKMNKTKIGGDKVDPKKERRASFAAAAKMAAGAAKWAKM